MKEVRGVVMPRNAKEATRSRNTNAAVSNSSLGPVARARASFHAVGVKSIALALAGFMVMAAGHISRGESPATTQGASTLWPSIGHQQKPWTRWWWPGNAVDKENLSRQIEQIAAAGFGGVEVTPIYGLKGAEGSEIEFLSPKYMELLKHAAAEAKRHGMRLDMATGTGWPFGGPWVTPEDGDAKFARDGESVGSKPTGMKVKRASPGGAGLVLNPFSPDAMTRYLRPFDNAFGNAKFPNDLIRCQFHDSFEYQGNWSPGLLDRFKDSRGYDLRDQAAALFGQGDADTAARVKYDYRLTLEQRRGRWTIAAFVAGD